MNSSNQTVSAGVDKLFDGLTTATYVFSYYSVAVHFAYFLLILVLKQFRKRALVLINHAVIVSAIYPCNIFFFQFVNPVVLMAQKQVELVTGLCSFFEFLWPIANYMRMFSVLIVAVHRYIATFKPDLFRRINDSNWFLVLTIASTWIAAIALTAIDKYAFKTTYSLTLCLDGYSNNWTNSLLYAIFYVVISMFLPTIAIVIIYVLIHRKLKSIAQNLASNSRIKSEVDRARERRYANQFVLMCVAVVLNICGISIFSIRSLIVDFLVVFYYWRLVIRCWSLFTTSLIPLLSFAFNPYVKHVVTRSTSRFTTRVFTQTQPTSHQYNNDDYEKSGSATNTNTNANLK